MKYFKINSFLHIAGLAIILLPTGTLKANDGYKLWLDYVKITDVPLLAAYRAGLSGIVLQPGSKTMDAAGQELTEGLQIMLDRPIENKKVIADGSIIIGTPASSQYIRKLLANSSGNLGEEGYSISATTIEGKTVTVIAANSDAGVLYGTFGFLRLLQTHQDISHIRIVSIPKIKYRILNHWDNINRSVERGYAGMSIWNWHELPDVIDQRYIDYARSNASIGINGSVLTNVNANSTVLTTGYLKKVKALADVFRVYGIKVFLTARFSAPIEIGGLSTADPLNDQVKKWWQNKCDEIYSLIPDFGGFLIKANSEGQPGPQTYGRSHADGANLFADAISPHGGIIFWRAFVYDLQPGLNSSPSSDKLQQEGLSGSASPDRFKQAYLEFKSLDGKFRKNVILQIKNGPLDFQPREPFSPLFGALRSTPEAMEFQITQEYLGQGTHLVYEAPLFKEVLDADTYSDGTGSTVAKIIDGSVLHQSLTCISGVSNIGNEHNWTNHPLAQSNWYAFGRLAWDYNLSSRQIAEEWIRQTFSNDSIVVPTIAKITMASREALVNYMTPLGLHHIMGTGHHYGPAPWVDNLSRKDWNPVYYHKADQEGIGFDRTATGSDGLGQYQPAVRKQWMDSNTCDERFVLWFHHLSWSHQMKSGSTLWNELCNHYQQGVDSVRWMKKAWTSLENRIDPQRYQQVLMLLKVQEKEAEWWRDACLLYFQTFSKLPFPAMLEKPKQTLEYYKGLSFPFSPGINGNL